MTNPGSTGVTFATKVTAVPAGTVLPGVIVRVVLPCDMPKDGVVHPNNTARAVSNVNH
jgi:hypothetical protein